jgi:Anti-sigma-K factor rskA
MLAAHMERIRNGLAALQPESRAMLELSLRRRVSDVDIAHLLGVEPDAVDSRRELALAGLASELGLDSRAEIDELRAALPDLPRDLWVIGMGAGDLPEPPEPVQAPPEPAAPEPAEPTPEPVESDEPRRQRGSRGVTWALLGVLAIVAVAAAIALTSGGGDSRSKPSPKAGPTSSRAGSFQALPGEKGSGRATVRGRVLSLRLSGLPAAGSGGYEAWLYTTLADARSLGRVRSGTLTAKLPANARKYRFVDVSREPADGNPNHSGASVVRVPLAPLLLRP